MLCKGCIKQIFKSLSEEGKKMLGVIASYKNKDELTRNRIQKEYLKKHDEELTYSAFIKIRRELENKLFIKSKTVGQTKIYSLTDNGNKLIEMTSKR